MKTNPRLKKNIRLYKNKIKLQQAIFEVYQGIRDKQSRKNITAHDHNTDKNRN